MTAVEFQPDYANPPGRTIVRLLAEHDMTQTQLARRLGVSLKHVNQVVKGNASVSSELAVGLERVLGPSVEYWMTREATFQADRVRLLENESLAEHVPWAKAFPTRDLQDQGFIARTTGSELVRSLLRFFAIASPEQFEPVDVPFRKSQKVQSDRQALAAWVRAGELRAADIECEPFDADKFRDALQDIRGYTQLDPAEWNTKLVDACRQAGVAVVVVPHFKGASVNGAAKWLTPTKALIVLSRRYQWQDIFWFSFFHEAGHILLHRKKQTFIDVDKGSTADQEIEDEANNFAGRMLIPAEYNRRLKSMQLWDVKAFARQIGVHPGIVVGRLHHDEVMKPYVGVKLREQLPEWFGYADGPPS